MYYPPNLLLCHHLIVAKWQSGKVAKIFERKGVYRMYDLKTVHGKSSVDTQLLDSIGQANRILLNMTSNYNPRTLAKDIRRYFERNANAVEVLIMKGTRPISVIREDTLGQSYIRNFMMKYRQK